jgi:pyruvate kinase
VTGEVVSRRGVSLSGANITLQVPTDDDRRLAKFAKGEKFDYIAMSFVRSADQIAQLRKDIGKAFIISKIERADAVEDADDIAAHSDAVMVARGDLGLDLPVEEVPIAQIKIMAAAKRNKKPVIVATQVLLSMLSSPIPTRAEVNDIANSVLNGADYIMLSEETARGDHPVEAVETLDRAIRAIEKYQKR